MSDAVTDAILSLNRQLDLPSVLNKMLEAAMKTTGAPLAAINVLDDQGVSVDFHYQGMDPSIWKMIGRAPNSRGHPRTDPGRRRARHRRDSPSTLLRGTAQGPPAARFVPGVRVARARVRSSATCTSRPRRAASPRSTRPPSPRSLRPRPSRSTTRSCSRSRSSARIGSPRRRRSPPPCWPTRATRRPSSASSRPPRNSRAPPQPRSCCPASTTNGSWSSPTARRPTSCWAWCCRPMASPCR